MKDHSYLLLITCYLFLALFIGCAGLAAQEAQERTAIRATFAQLAQGMIQGDLKSTYDLLSANFKRYQSYEDFVKEYEINRDKLIDRFQDAFLKFVSVEGTMASAIVVWGTGEQGLLEFIKESQHGVSGWRLERKGAKSY